MLAIQIERRFTKEQIFTLYANQIYLGHGVYGFAAAPSITSASPPRTSRSPKPPSGRTAEGSTILFANLHPERALQRRNLVLNAMLEDGKITARAGERGEGTPITIQVSQYMTEFDLRHISLKRFVDISKGHMAVTRFTRMACGFTPRSTSICRRRPTSAALDGLAAYERRHGWKGKLVNVVAQGAVL